MDHTHPTPSIPSQNVATYADGLVSTPPPPHTDTTSLVEMLSRIDALDVIPRLQVATTTALQLQTPSPRVPGETVQDNVEVTTTPLATVTMTTIALLPGLKYGTIKLVTYPQDVSHPQPACLNSFVHRSLLPLCLLQMMEHVLSSS